MREGGQVRGGDDGGGPRAAAAALIPLFTLIASLPEVLFVLNGGKGRPNRPLPPAHVPRPGPL